jgi:hypothetical protein
VSRKTALAVVIDDRQLAGTPINSVGSDNVYYVPSSDSDSECVSNSLRAHSATVTYGADLGGIIRPFLSLAFAPVESLRHKNSVRLLLHVVRVQLLDR